jgi:hypothetical protein
MFRALIPINHVHDDRQRAALSGPRRRLGLSLESAAVFSPLERLAVRRGVRARLA